VKLTGGAVQESWLRISLLFVFDEVEFASLAFSPLHQEQSFYK
jgi:hypothetical protein